MKAVGSALLEVQDLSVQFDLEGQAVHALRQVSCTVERNRIVAVVGESGSGKTVLALTIMGLLPRPPARVTGGVVNFDGRNLLVLDPARLRALRGKRIGMIFQEPMTALNPVLRIGEQIAEIIRIHEGAPRRQAWQRAVALLEQVGIDEPSRRARQYPHELSGGMQQRVMIAMALSCRAELLIADEPTTALDVTTQAQILALLRDVQQRTGIAILLITHDFGVVAEMADDIYVMLHGRIVEHASVGRLFERPQHEYTRSLLASVPRID